MIMPLLRTTPRIATSRINKRRTASHLPKKIIPSSTTPPLLRFVTTTITTTSDNITSTPSSPHPTPNPILSKLTIGGSKASRLPITQYSQIISTALSHGINKFESGLDDGDDALATAYELSLKTTSSSSSSSNNENGVILTSRVGYRSLVNSSQSDETTVTSTTFPGDVSVDNDAAYHNLSRDYISHCIENHPLCQLKKRSPSSNISLILMAHNPETQGAAAATGDDALPSRDDIRSVVISRMTDAFVCFEEACRDGSISGYGVCSNGLGLPRNHGLFLDWRDVIDAACVAAKEIHGRPTIPKLSTIQLPANLLETNGFSIAGDIHSFINSTAAASSSDRLPTSLTTAIYRPLTCHPDGGVSSSHPFKLVDYNIPLSSPFSNNNNNNNKNDYIATHRLPNIPPYYQTALNRAMGHFDATHLIEKLQSSSSSAITPDERDTLEGCRLLQDMIRNLDATLDDARSYSSYESDLVTKIMPLLSETFEEMDDDTGGVLQEFFVCHAAAMKWSVARMTRRVLREGEDGGSKGGGGGGGVYYDVGEEESLQEFALRYAW